MSAPVQQSPTLFTAEDVFGIASDVWSCFLGEEPVPALEHGGGPTSQGVLAVIGITGAWSGLVMLELSEAAATAAAETMLRSHRVTPAQVADTSGELVNMVGGNLKGLLPAPSALGLPVVTRQELGRSGPPAVAGLPGEATQACRADLAWPSGTARFTVWDSTVRPTQEEQR